MDLNLLGGVSPEFIKKGFVTQFQVVVEEFAKRIGYDTAPTTNEEPVRQLLGTWTFVATVQDKTVTKVYTLTVVTESESEPANFLRSVLTKPIMRWEQRFILIAKNSLC